MILDATLDPDGVWRVHETSSYANGVWRWHSLPEVKWRKFGGVDRAELEKIIAEEMNKQIERDIARFFYGKFEDDD